MTPSPVPTVRNVVPRWRSLRRTIEARELSFPAPPGNYREVLPVSDEFRTRMETWRRVPGVVSAAEVVEIALVEGNETEAIAAARALMSDHFSPTPLVRAQARRLLERKGEIEESVSPDVGVPARRLRYWRQRTRAYPMDALAWVELARLQFAVGVRDAAVRSMMVARQIAPDNRHVIRSAARMLLHLHQPDVAHDFIRRCGATRFDPWLTAAEIAIASHRNKTPQLFKAGISLIDSGDWRPHQTNELAAAVGTILLNDGYRKRGKRMMMLGLADPTGNTLAQAEWATAKFGDTLLQASTLKTSTDANEARTLRFYRTGQYGKSLESAVEWIDEEPFSNRAHIAATAAASILEDYPRTLELADAGLKFDPKSLSILHNRVYALACSGMMDDAERILESIEKSDEPDHIAEANRGLIAFRRGHVDDGVRRYRAAIAGFKKVQSAEQERVALSYLAREAVRANAPKAEELLHEAEKTLGNSDSQQARKVLKDARTMLEAQQLRL